MTIWNVSLNEKMHIFLVGKFKCGWNQSKNFDFLKNYPFTQYFFFFQLDQELSADDRKQKHVSFDSSSLMRSQTLATMDEASFQRMAAVVASQTMASSPSKSSERLIDGRKTPEFELYSQIFPPELARQIMMGKNDCLRRNTVWKFQYFLATLILREIDSGASKNSKTALFATFRTLHFVVLWILAFKNAKIHTNWIQSTSKCLKMVDLETLDSRTKFNLYEFWQFWRLKFTK